MTLEIVHYFAPMSGYAYLGVAALEELAARHGCVVKHAPVDIAAVFAASGVTPPAVQSPARKAYRRADMRRWAEHRGLPLNEQPKHWPVPGARAAQYILAAEKTASRGAQMSAAVLAAVWARDLDISNDDVLMDLAGEIGLDAALLRGVADEPEMAATARDLTEKAIGLGLFGSPTYVIGDTIFFGQDRLEFLESEVVRLKSGTKLA